MDKFEAQCENLNVQTAYMDGAMMSSGALTTPTDQVENLIMQVADEHGLEMKMAIGSAPSSVAQAIPQEQNDELSARLNMLRNQQ
jgi:charged multivesicular body protein 1